MTHPVVLEKTGFAGSDDHVHAKPALVETAIGSQFIQSLQCRGGQNGHRTQVEERTFGNRGREACLGEESRSELALDKGVSMACRIEILDVGDVCIDGKILGSAPNQCHFAVEPCRQQPVDITGFARH